jgi:hypothetical protein
MTKNTQAKIDSLGFLLNKEVVEKYLKDLIKEMYKKPFSDEAIKSDKILREIYSPEILSKVITDIVFESGKNN